jgi:hypothetical protein
MTGPAQGAGPRRGVWGPLAEGLVVLADVVDDAALVDTLLSKVVVDVVDTVGGVDYASVTAWRGTGYTTVAASSDLARAVDEAKYGERAGPCVLAAETAAPVGAPDVAATMSWPGFYRRASELGLRAVVSVPVFAGGGAPVAVLNLYGRETGALTALMVGVRDVFAAEQPPAGGYGRDVDAGTQQFLAGLGKALRKRATIQQTVGVLMASDGGQAAQAYEALRELAARAGISLSAAAQSVVG